MIILTKEEGSGNATRLQTLQHSVIRLLIWQEFLQLLSEQQLKTEQSRLLII